MRRWPALLGALAGVTTPSLALACAACARDQGRLAWLMVGSLLAAPYLLVAGVLWALRRAGVRP